MVDSEFLIGEIEKRPLLWDTSEEEYKDKVKRNAAWIAVASNLIERFPDKTDAEQKIIIQDLEKKWRSIRDNFIRSRKRCAEATRSGSGNTRLKKYIYEQQLRFLDKNTEKRATDSSIVERTDQETIDEKKCDSDIDEGKVEGPTTSKMTGKRVRKVNIEEKLIQFMDAHKVNRELSDDDEDSAFFKSLLPTVKKLNSDQKFTFRMQTMQLLHNIQKSSMETNNEQSRSSSAASLFSNFSGY